MLRVKGQDGYCPIGPGLVPGVDVRESTLRTYINARSCRRAALTEMTFRSTHPRRPLPPHHAAAG